MAKSLANTTQEDQNLETYCLIWLDASVNGSQENIQAQKQLRSSINHLMTFEDDQQCLKYIQSVPKDDRIILIVSGRLGQIIVPKIVTYRQISSIYVYCRDKKANEQWAKQFKKVRAVTVELDELIYRIQTDQHEWKHNKANETLPLCTIDVNDIDEGQSITELSGQFLHFQLFIDCLIKMKSTANDKKELISLCKQHYQENCNELSIIEEFEREYSSDRALWWYTRDSFLYRMLNKALRVQNIHLLFLFRYIIHDIEQQLEKYKCQTPIRVYRAQLMSNEEVQMLKDSLGEFLSINSFFSTSLDRQQARSFFSSDHNSNDDERVFLEIDADPQIENIKPFSDISLHSYYPGENEVLFMIGSIFRPMNIDRDKDGILIVRMKLCSNNDHHLQPLFRHMQKKRIPGNTNLLDLGSILQDMGKWNDAEKYYHRFLNESPDNEKGIARCYRGLGIVATKNGDYESSLKYHNKSLDIKMRTLNPNQIDIAASYNNIGHVYEKTKNYKHALESYEKALVIYKQALGEDDPEVATCVNNMGNLHMNEKKYTDALSLYHKALSIWEKHLPADHTDLGRSHKNIGNIHCRLGQYDLALSHYNMSLKIYKKSRPSQHPSIALTLENIGVVYEHKGDFQEALSYFERAAAILRHSLPPTHMHVIKIEKAIQRVSSKLK